MSDESYQKNLKADMEGRLSAMKDGESFFMSGTKPGDLSKIRSMGYRLGIKLSIRWMTVDPIYGCSGTRVYRIKGPE